MVHVPSASICQLRQDDRSPEGHQTTAPKRSSTLQNLGSAVSRTSGSLPKVLRFQGGFQDAEGVLTTQMLVAAIILSIVVTLHTGTFSHDALVAGDLRHAKFDVIRGKELMEDSYERFVSGRLFVHGYISVSCSAYSLLSAAAIYISLIFSGARDDAALFQRWWRFGRVFILLSYVALLVSIVYFLRLNHDSVYLVYPKYNWNSVLNVTADAARRLGAARGSSAAGAPVGQEEVGDASSMDTMFAEGERHYGHDVANMSKNVKIAMNYLLGITAGLLAAGHAWFNLCRASSDADSHDASLSQNSEASAEGLLVAQSEVLKAQNELLAQFLQRLPMASGLVNAPGGIGASWPVGAPLDIEAQTVQSSWRESDTDAHVPIAPCPSSKSTTIAPCPSSKRTATLTASISHVLC